MQPIVDGPMRTSLKARAARRGGGGVAFLMQRAAEDLAERLAIVSRRFSAPVALFCQTPDAARAMMASGRLDAPVIRIEAPGQHLGAADRVIDPETGDLPEASADLVVSLLSLHGVNDLPGLLMRIRRMLRPDGLFLAAMPGAGTLRELSDSLLEAEAARGAVSPRVMPFADVRTAGALLQRAGFSLPVADTETLTVRYGGLPALMADLKAGGETNALSDRGRRPAGRGLFADAARIYAAHHADADGRLRATFSIVWMAGWAPHPDQQQPLKPGSARQSLASALKALE